MTPDFEQTLDRCPCGSAPVVAGSGNGVRISCRYCGKMDVECATENKAMVEWNKLCRKKEEGR